MQRRLFAIAAAAAVAFSAAPADAAFAPTFTITEGQIPGGSPNAGRVVTGYITLSSADTYVTGGFNITPQNLGFNNGITSIIAGSPSGSFDVATSTAAGVATIKILAPISGASNVAATATTATVTPGVTLNANTPIVCTLDDAATAGGATGTWPVTDAVSSCKYASATTFTITVIAAAPTNGGNFTWALPSISSELAAGTNVASYVIPFIATGI